MKKRVKGPGTNLEMRERLFGKQLMLAQSLENDRVRTLTVQLNLSVRCAHDRRHALPCRVELAYIQDLVLDRLPIDVDKH